ncbi:MAG: DUF3293 domain-containing protein [Nitrosomonas sp.]|uniref:DUF3293 domain-containing protein n=1 Tax=Nitrosomonas sp. TaxID=42353 RepID=UPI0025FDE91B|nr:DUF3293 domain-containing protein [Nitrosomonas sp.]MBY0474071.1 DUF3293 domain-containing protein [Nitrosomonas sp.]
MIRSLVAKSLTASYHNTHYQVGTGSDALVLRIDQHSKPLTKFLETFKQSFATIISAYNPCSRLVSNEMNLIAHELLRNYLNHHAYAMIESLNVDPFGKWPSEKSLFVPGLDLNTARSIGQQFNQNAIVWINSEAIPRLMLLR